MVRRIVDGSRRSSLVRALTKCEVTMDHFCEIIQDQSIHEDQQDELMPRRLIGLLNIHLRQVAADGSTRKMPNDVSVAYAIRGALSVGLADCGFGDFVASGGSEKRVFGTDRFRLRVVNVEHGCHRRARWTFQYLDMFTLSSVFTLCRMTMCDPSYTRTCQTERRFCGLLVAGRR